MAEKSQLIRKIRQSYKHGNRKFSKMNEKTVFFVAFLAVFVAVAASNVVPVTQEEIELLEEGNLSHNLEAGSHENGERLMLKQSIIKDKKWLQVVTVQQTFNVTQYQKITVVRALDQKVNGNGATPSLLSGGPAFNYVTLLFTSKRGHSVNFVVEIYAK